MSFILDTAGSLLQGSAAKSAADHNAAIAQNDALRSQNEAAARAAEVVRRTRQTLAETRAAAGANGLALTGSVSDLLGQAETQGNLDALTAVYEGKVRSDKLRSQADSFRAAGANAQTASRFQAAGSLFSGSAKAYGQFQQLGYF